MATPHIDDDKNKLDDPENNLSEDERSDLRKHMGKNKDTNCVTFSQTGEDCSQECESKKQAPKYENCLEWFVTNETKENHKNCHKLLECQSVRKPSQSLQA